MPTTVISSCCQIKDMAGRVVRKLALLSGPNNLPQLQT